MKYAEQLKELMELLPVVTPFDFYLDSNFSIDEDEHDVSWADTSGEYSGEIKYGVGLKGDCTYITIDDGCGSAYTIVFKTSNQVESI